MTGTFSQVGLLARRSVQRTLRQPAEYLPAIIFPLVMLTVLVGGLRPSADLPGFPTESYFEFALAGLFIQGAITNGINSGNGLAFDIQSGFLRRLGLTAVRPAALLAAQLSGAAVVGLIQAVIFLGVGFAFGAEFESGMLGVLVIVGFMLLATMAFGAAGALIALKTGSSEAVQGIAPALTFLMFLSSFLVPRVLIEVDWFRAIASANPMSYLIEGIRSLVLNDWDPVALGRFLAVGGGMMLLFIAAASGAFTKRMAMR